MAQSEADEVNESFSVDLLNAGFRPLERELPNVPGPDAGLAVLD